MSSHHQKRETSSPLPPRSLPEYIEYTMYTLYIPKSFPFLRKRKTKRKTKPSREDKENEKEERKKEKALHKLPILFPQQSNAPPSTKQNKFKL